MEIKCQHISSLSLLLNGSTKKSQANLLSSICSKWLRFLKLLRCESNQLLCCFLFCLSFWLRQAVHTTGFHKRPHQTSFLKPNYSKKHFHIKTTHQHLLHSENASFVSLTYICLTNWTRHLKPRPSVPFLGKARDARFNCFQRTSLVLPY